MRVLERWPIFEKKYVRMKFPPRIALDLEAIKIPDDLKGDDSVNSAFIHGEVETGKTIRACQMMLKELRFMYINSISGQHNSTIFVPFEEMLRNIKQAYSPSKTIQVADILDKYFKAHLIVIDDFMSTRPTDWVIEIIYAIINTRYENMKKTIITSNHSLKELETMLEDQRITSRINRMCKIEEKLKY